MNIETTVFLVAIVLFPIALVYYWRRKSALSVSLRVASLGSLFFYAAILITVFAIDHRLNIELEAFDLDGDGFFSGEELTPDQALAMKRVVNDAGRNFAFITGFIYALIYGVIVFPIIFVVSFLQNKLLHLTLKKRANE
ncbi:MAG: hypothetical protein ACI9DO_000804 [Reinekea sp.]|jgi:hypothetical protein|uniref:hypothetical protein n=1 Tax=Reinekea sp. TaxID=1970455 RepID=UPI003989C791